MEMLVFWIAITTKVGISEVPQNPREGRDLQCTKACGRAKDEEDSVLRRLRSEWYGRKKTGENTVNWVCL